MTDFKRIEFKAFDGTTFSGNFFEGGGDKTPALVMAQGLTPLNSPASASALSSIPIWVHFAVWRMSACRASCFASIMEAPDRTSPAM
jgi:hypothetical protein